MAFRSRYSHLNGLTQSGRRSKFEDDIATSLSLRNIGFLYEPKEAKIEYIIKHTYNPDIVFLNNYIFIEAKGWFKPEDKRKMLAVKKQHPNLDIRMVFQNAHTPKKGTQNWQWAEKRGFKWSHAGIPLSWTKEPVCEANKQFLIQNGFSLENR